MNRYLTAITVATLALSLAACGAKGDKKVNMESKSAKLSYALGHEVGTSLRDFKTDIDPAVLNKGIEDGLAGLKPVLSAEEMVELKKQFMMKVQADQTEKMKSIADKNVKDEEAFFAENKKKSGVVTTASGLQYTIVTEGKGTPPKATDKVSVNYRGTLLDGTEFDSSYKRGQAASFPVNGVIPGWTEALQLMKPGGKYRLFIPAKLAYAERGAGRQIGPNAALIFEVELVSIEK